MDLPENQEFLTSEEIEKNIFDKIISLEYMPGCKLSETALAGQYGVSRHIIRKALSTLVQKNLIVVYPQRGTFVTLIDMKRVRDVMYLRCAAESLAAEDLIDGGDHNRKEVCRKMRENLALQQKAVERAPGGFLTPEYQKLDREFHEMVFVGAGRPNVMDLLKDDMEYFYRWRNLELKVLNRLPEITDQHEQMVRLLEEKNTDGYRQLMKKHINSNYFADVDMQTHQKYFVQADYVFPK